MEYAFDLLEVGCTGTIEVIPESINKTSKKELQPLTTVSFLIKLLTELLCRLSLVNRFVYIRVCKHFILVCIFENDFVKAIQHFFHVFTASSKHTGYWEYFRKLCRPSTMCSVCRTAFNSPKPPRVFLWGYVKTDKNAVNRS